MPQRLLAVLLLLCLLAACSPLGPADPTPTPPVPTATRTDPSPTGTVAAAESSPSPVESAPTPGASPTDSTTPGPQAEATIPPALQRQVTTIESQAATVRGLRPKSDVLEHFITPAQMQDDLKQQIADEYPRDEAREDALELWLLRLIDDRDTDLYQVQIDLLGEQVLGYYDIKQKELFVRNDEQPLGVEAQETLAHEFVHSLQDEYYDLQKLRPEHSHDSDRDLAATALIEGDASLAGILFAQKYMSESDFQTLIQQSQNAPSAQLDKAPPYIRDGLLFPYDQGAAFVIALYKAGGFPAIDQAFAHPPTSSEQILHPEKYLTRQPDAPQPVTVPPLTDTLGADWTLHNQDTLGEFDLAELLKVNGVDDATATEGWGGAGCALYEGQSAAVLITATRWDTAEDATEFDAALRKSLATARQDGDLWSDAGRFFGIQTSGDRVTFVAGTDRTAVEQALGASQ
jgi:hypothetical protein